MPSSGNSNNGNPDTPEPGQSEALKRMTKMVNAFLSRPDSGPFREPVDWRGLELHDYPEVIKHMMDLGTIKRKLERNQYRNAAQVAADLRLVWNNCMTYNAEGSDFWNLAKAFARRFEDRYRRVKSDLDVGEEPEPPKTNTPGGADQDEDEEGDDQDEADGLGDDDDEEEMMETMPDGRDSMTLDARAALAANLLMLTGPELGYVVRTVEVECPQAIEKISPLSVPGKMELVVDQLSPKIFAMISEYAQERAEPRLQQQMEEAANNIPPINDISNRRKRKR